VVLRGFGTATLDGVPAAGEWDAAGHVDFTVNRSSSEGGGTVPATLYAMNNAQNLYFALKVMNATISSSAFDLEFDSDLSGGNLQEGEDELLVNNGGVWDQFMHQIAPNTWQAVRDQDYGGTNDMLEGEADNPGFSFYEWSHPLNDTDEAHDFSLGFAKRVGFQLSFRHCYPCASPSYFPDSHSYAKVVVVSGSRVPPDTQITSGPQGTVRTVTASFDFTGTDDAIAPADLTFECKLGEDSWRDCASPHADTYTDGSYTLSVRAIDEMLNVDPTPAQRTWILDTTGPSKPVIRGPRSVRKGVLTVRFSSSDEFTPTGRIRYKCALDSRRLKSCPAVFRKRVRPGRHVLRAKAVDSVGNQGDLATFRILVKQKRR
jgi:hypothetical protein